ncbi:MAG: carbon storage regulator [Pirellulaceae bacterium]
MLFIGGNVIVFLADIGGSKVRLGVEAPKEVFVHRKEGIRYYLKNQSEVITEVLTEVFKNATM